MAIVELRPTNANRIENSVQEVIASIKENVIGPGRDKGESPPRKDPSEWKASSPDIWAPFALMILEQAVTKARGSVYDASGTGQPELKPPGIGRRD
jgi:hypothetical protein